MQGSLEQLLEYWANDLGTGSEILIRVLETLRDELAQAQLPDGRRLQTVGNVREFINQVVSNLARGTEERSEKPEKHGRP